jgi:acyl-coenzyme A thioesterase PaaI-like protein
VTAALEIHFLRPTPSDRPVLVLARAVESDRRAVTVEGTIEADGATTATATGRFVAVGPGHPAYGRWRGD